MAKCTALTGSAVKGLMTKAFNMLKLADCLKEYDQLKPVPFVNFEIYPPGRVCMQELWEQSGACYGSQRISVVPISANGFESIKWTRTFSNKGGDVMGKMWECHWRLYRVCLFYPPAQYEDDSRIGRMLSPTRETDNHFLWLKVVSFK